MIRGWQLLIVCGALALTLAAFAVAIVQLNALARENGRAKDALCTLRDDLQRRVDSSTEFLSEHPDGIPGISAKTIQDGIANQQRTVSALRALQCG